MDYIIAAIAGALALLVAFIFRDRSKLHDNGSGAAAIGNGLADSHGRAVDISGQVVSASSAVTDIAGHIQSASTILGGAISLVRAIRERGANPPSLDDPGADRD